MALIYFYLGLALIGVLMRYLLWTHQKHQKISQELEECRSTLEAWNHFTLIASHELKAPLTVLSTQNHMAERILGKLSIEDEQLKAIFLQGRYSMERLTLLVDQLADFPRLGSGTMELSKMKMNLAEHATKLIEHLESGGVSKPGLISISVEGDPHGHFDPVRIEQVLINLLTNALKYGHGKPVSISIQDSVQPEWVRIRIRDQGHGISISEQEKIFQQFERTDAARKSAPGMGLGLFISKGIVEAHQGTLSVKSELLCGSEFTIELPRQSNASTAQELN